VQQPGKVVLEIYVWSKKKEKAKEKQKSDNEMSASSAEHEKEEIFTPEILREYIRIRSPFARNLLTEFFGTAMLLFIGLSTIMQFILSDEKLNTWIQINIGWGLAVGFCVYLGAKTS
ncbi:hypothetical protein TELCIR_16947, partial [Teladorsagia circumcincta]